MRTIFIALLASLLLALPLLAQENAAGEIKNISELYRKGQFSDAVIKATGLLAKPALSKSDSILTIRWLSKAAAQNNQAELAQQYLATLVKMDPNTDFDGDKEPARFAKVWFKFVGDTKYVPGQRQNKLSVAVVEFDNGSFQDADKVKNVGIGIAAMLRYDLESSGAVYSPSREHFNYLLDELKLSQTELVDKDQKLQVGKVIGAQNFIFGTFFNMPGNKFRIDARVIETETTLPKKQFSIEGKASDIGKLTVDLTKQILTYFSVEAEAIKKAGANIPNVNLAALNEYSRGVAYEEKGQMDLAKKSYAEAIRISPSFALATDRQARVELEQKSDNQ
jgi:tetratricopeptide (TPR) repeat protein